MLFEGAGPSGRLDDKRDKTSRFAIGSPRIFPFL